MEAQIVAIVGTGTLLSIEDVAMGYFAATTAPGSDTAKDCPTSALEDEQSGADQSSRKTINRGPNGQNNSPEEGDAQLEEETNEDDANGYKPEQAKDYSANE